MRKRNGFHTMLWRGLERSHKLSSPTIVGGAFSRHMFSSTAFTRQANNQVAAPRIERLATDRKLKDVAEVCSITLDVCAEEIVEKVLQLGPKKSARSTTTTTTIVCINLTSLQDMSIRDLVMRKMASRFAAAGGGQDVAENKNALKDALVARRVVPVLMSSAATINDILWRMADPVRIPNAHYFSQQYLVQRLEYLLQENIPVEGKVRIIVASDTKVLQASFMLNQTRDKGPEGSSDPSTEVSVEPFETTLFVDPTVHRTFEQKEKCIDEFLMKLERMIGR